MGFWVSAARVWVWRWVGHVLGLTSLQLPHGCFRSSSRRRTCSSVRFPAAAPRCAPGRPAWRKRWLRRSARSTWRREQASCRKTARRPWRRPPASACAGATPAWRRWAWFAAFPQRWACPGAAWVGYTDRSSIQENRSIWIRGSQEPDGRVPLASGGPRPHPRMLTELCL